MLTATDLEADANTTAPAIPAAIVSHRSTDMIHEDPSTSVRVVTREEGNIVIIALPGRPPIQTITAHARSLARLLSSVLPGD